jgi:hypothetical protein
VENLTIGGKPAQRGPQDSSWPKRAGGETAKSFADAIHYGGHLAAVRPDQAESLQFLRRFVQFEAGGEPRFARMAQIIMRDYNTGWILP